jgi:drug/metabolite transporter (DMT)-like permease
MTDYLKIVLAMLIWSTWGLIIRWMALPPVVVLFYTSLIGGITVPVVLKVRGDFPHDVFDLKSWYLFAGLAVSSILNNLAYFYALGHTTVSNAVFTHYTAPVFVAVLAPFLIAERLRRVTLLALPVAAAGMVLIVVSGRGPSLSGAHLPGILAGIASGVGYAFVVIFTRYLSRMLLHHKAIIVLLWITILATAPAALSAAYIIDRHTGILLLITGILHSTTAPIMYFSALKRVLAQHAAILGYIEPLAAIPLAFLFLSEKPPLIALLGGTLILFSGYLIVRSRLTVAGSPERE